MFAIGESIEFGVDFSISRVSCRVGPLVESSGSGQVLELWTKVSVVKLGEVKWRWFPFDCRVAGQLKSTATAIAHKLARQTQLRRVTPLTFANEQSDESKADDY